MNYKISSFLFLLSLFLWQMTSCNAQNSPQKDDTPQYTKECKNVEVGAQRTAEYLPLLQGKRVALLINQTSVIQDARHQNIPLIDTLLSAGVDVRFLMAPEHGFEGKISAGGNVANTLYDKKKSLQIYSLYGKTKKPLPEWLDQADCVVFDIQDVGCRFYTYLSTLYYLLQACGENNKEVIVLDRPNPNDTIDGPMLDMQFQSFVGMVPVPLLHGCTLGELALMMIGEGWLGSASPKLTVIPVSNWNHGEDYALPIAPSPNLRTDHAIRLYPSLCLFEATDISVGRGTDWPFEVLGHPLMQGEFEFIPQHCIAAAHPLQEGKTCHGIDLRSYNQPKGFSLQWLLQCRQQWQTKNQPDNWIKQTKFFDRLAGTDQLRMQICSGMAEDAIRLSWQSDLNQYRAMRSKYLIYK